MNALSKIYVAGHTGLVGSAIVRALKNSGFNNLIVRNPNELDLRKQVDVDNFFDKNKPEYVFLAAAKVGGIWANNTQKANFIYDNLMISANVINAAKNAGVQKFLNLGSSCIYPKLAPQPLKEEYLLSGQLEETNDAYSIAKIAAIKLCKCFNEQFNTNFISVMPTNLYGQNDNFNLETSHVLPAMIRKFHLAKLLKEKNFAAIRSDFDSYPVEANPTFEAEWLSDAEIEAFLNKNGIEVHQLSLWGTGNAFREFLHVDDLANALIFLMKNYNYKDIGEIINIGSGEDLKIKKLAQKVKDIVKFDGQIQFDNKKPDGVPKKLLDISKMSNLGWKPIIGLDDGIKKCYQWYLNTTQIIQSTQAENSKSISL